MKRLFLKIAFVLLSVAVFSTAKASHVMAGQIAYEHAGADSLFVTLTIYRDCNGVTMSNSPLLVKAIGYSKSELLSLVSVKDVTGINPACSTSSRCSGTYTYGIEEYVYTGLVILPSSSACEFTFSWEQCCRNNAITTGAASQNFYIETTYDRCLAPVNNSPGFVSMPVILIPYGQDLSLMHSATDADGDLVTYELTDPLMASGSAIAYSGSWSKDKPLTFLGFPNVNTAYPGGFRFDSLSGNMFFRPTLQNQITVVSVKAKEWRIISGILTKIGETVRDVQLLVISPGANTVPQIGAGSMPLFYTCTPNATVCKTIRVEDADSSDSVFVDYKHNLPAVSFTPTRIAANIVDVEVCITIDSAMYYGNSNYFFTLYGRDNYCPLPGINEKTILIKMRPVAPNVVPQDKVFCEIDSSAGLPWPGMGTWTGTGVNAMPPYQFSPATAGPGNHKIVYSYYDSSTHCGFTDSAYMRVVQRPVVSFTVNDSVGLPTDTFYFTNTTVADTTYTLEWNMGDTAGIQYTHNTPQHVYPQVGSYTVKLKVWDSICPPDSFMRLIVVDTATTLGLANFKNEGLKIYPVPAGKLLIVEAQADIRSICFTDMLGRQRKFDTPSGTREAELNIEWLENGVYVITVTDETGRIYTGKVLVQR